MKRKHCRRPRLGKAKMWLFYIQKDNLPQGKAESTSSHCMWCLTTEVKKQLLLLSTTTPAGLVHATQCLDRNITCFQSQAMWYAAFQRRQLSNKTRHAIQGWVSICHNPLCFPWIHQLLPCTVLGKNKEKVLWFLLLFQSARTHTHTQREGKSVNSVV